MESSIPIPTDTPAAPAPASAPAPIAPPAPAPAHFADADGLFKTVCRGFMARKCAKKDCKFVHDKQLCAFFWRTGACKFGDSCRKNHFVTVQEAADKTDNEAADSADDDDAAASQKKPKSKREPRKKEPKADGDGQKSEDKQTSASKKTKKKEPKQHATDEKKGKKDTKPAGSQLKLRTAKKNTECFEPMNRPVDLRVTYDLGTSKDTFSTSLTSRDVLLAPNIFNDFQKGQLYTRLMHEIDHCGVPEERLLKMWHGNDKIDGTHLIADDKTRWKTNCPTFQLVVDRLKAFFRLNVQATRFNWYRDTSQWKPFHFDAAAVKPGIAEKQNFTVAVSFGATRDAAFEHADTRTVVSLPQPDGCVYAFARDTNIIWRHGILQDIPVRQEGRISVIAWGWIDGMEDPLATVEPLAADA
ncbi:hypothetical protein P43SY_002398 [Pythium insidiosum]|uniref:C3H1-type domain-containing protein n=1 Tax=Pythium insidiosum TaxID=114742 RepID=A0AAD5M089_PYTIN|nr:hypothetical protein P43SY_002398 [Pythium insidiosum]